MTTKTGTHWVELRIHGVSGTPPEDMLCSAHVQQVAGDAWGRFFRPVDSLGCEIQPPGRILEGYHWGHFTSGSWRQGLWLILVPFGFVNAAAFMLPHPGTGRGVRSWHAAVGALIRGVGVGLTCTFALAASLILVNLVAWESAAHLPWLGKVPNGLVLAAGVVASAGVILGLHQMGNQNRGKLTFDDAPGSIAATQERIGLSRPAFYRGNPDAPILGWLHLSAGWAVVSLIGVLTARTISDRPLADALMWGSLGQLGLVTAATVLLGDPEQSVTGSDRHEIWQETVMPVAAPAACVLAGATVLGAASLLVGTDRKPVTLDFDSYARWLSAIMAGTVIVLLVATSVLAFLTRHSGTATPAPFRRYAAGLAPWAACATGLFLGVGFCGAFVLGVARAVGVTAQSALIYRVAYAWGLTTLLLALLALLGLAFVLQKRRTFGDESKAAFLAVSRTPKKAPCLPDRWWPRIAVAMGVARLKHAMPHVFLVCAVGGLAMTIVTAIEMFDGGLPAAFAWLSGDRDDGTFARFLINLGTYALIALAGLLFLLGRRAIRTERTRRGANVIWDVVSFWPHSAHPFVPAAYSQFAVRDLRRRIRFHLGLLEARPPEGPATCVVVSAHSQGSLIAFATMLWLDAGTKQTPGEIDRVGLVTYGSQLQVAFPRAFPAYVNHPLITKVHEALDRRWVNLYRDTDPIAGPVLSWDRSSSVELTSCGVGKVAHGADGIDHATGRRESGYDWRVLDPEPNDFELQLGPVVRLGRHSGFPKCVDYQIAVKAIQTGRAMVDDGQGDR